ncbi:unnamed protein product [Discosporangium mesarthrocarpum]
MSALKVLELFSPWGNRAIILISILLSLLLLGVGPDVPLSYNTLRVVHLLSFSSWFGTTVWVSFVNGIILFNTLDRENFSRATAKLFDAYFRFGFLFLAASIGSVAGLQSLGVAGQGGGEGASTLRWSNLAAALGCVLVNLTFLAPKTTAIMFERARLCKELGLDRKDPHPEVRKISKKFGMYHGITNLVNLVAMAFGVAHAFALGMCMTIA